MHRTGESALARPDPARIALTPTLLGCVVFFWVGGFDIIYACQDFEFDKKNGLFSIPARWGIGSALKMAAVSHVLAILSLFGFWYVAGLGYVFLTGVILVALLLGYEHWLVRPDDLTRVNIAFFNVNALFCLLKVFFEQFSDDTVTKVSFDDEFCHIVTLAVL